MLSSNCRLKLSEYRLEFKETVDGLENDHWVEEKAEEERVFYCKTADCHLNYEVFFLGVKKIGKALEFEGIQRGFEIEESYAEYDVYEGYDDEYIWEDNEEFRPHVLSFPWVLKPPLKLFLLFLISLILPIIVVIKFNIILLRVTHLILADPMQRALLMGWLVLVDFF